MLEKAHKFIQFAAVTFGMIIPCVMFSGFVYYLGYTTKYGLDPSFVPRSLGDFVSESWYLGVLAFGYLLKFWKWPLWIFGLLSLIYLVVMYIATHLKSKGKLKFDNPISKENPGRKILGMSQWNWILWWEMVENMYIWLVIPIVFLLLPILVLVTPFEKGKSDAQKQIDQFALHQCDPLKVKKDDVTCTSLIDISVTPNKVLMQGISVAANANRIAIYNGKVLEIWSLTNSMKIQKNVKGSKPFSTDD